MQSSSPTDSSREKAGLRSSEMKATVWGEAGKGSQVLSAMCQPAVLSWMCGALDQESQAMPKRLEL